jgi:uncharacterized protein (DUF697 family)
MLSRRKLIDQLYHTLELAVVKGTGVVPFVKPDVDDIVAQVNTLSGRTLDLRKPADFFDERLSVDVLDRVADDHTRKAQLLAATAGAGTGSLGLPGIALDVPILVTATVGLVRRHALTYGFTEIEDSQGDAVPLLLALGASVGAEFTIDQIAPRFAQKVGVDVGGKLVERFLLKRISEELAAKIMTSWLPRAVPVLGAATAAALDYAFLRATGWRSSRHYHAQHVSVRGQLARQRASEAASR